mgnify:CR=1 FL=1|tara:strand:- start:803 stop:1069 length:267 start_codon:yes stop_codon:yes gene_type:complete
MAIVVNFDERVSAFGNMHVVTGSFTISGGSSAEVLDLSDHLTAVHSITVNGSDNTQMHAWLTDVGDATANIKAAASNKSGIFMAIGFR